MDYLDEEKSTTKEIAKCYKSDIRTVYRDADKASEELASLMFGIDSIRFVE